MQCKDIPEKPILELMEKFTPRWCFLYWPDAENCVLHAMPKGVHRHLVQAKMAQMIKKGLVSGCACGCRGDFTITEKGRKTLYLRHSS